MIRRSSSTYSSSSSTICFLGGGRGGGGAITRQPVAPRVIWARGGGAFRASVEGAMCVASTASSSKSGSSVCAAVARVVAILVLRASCERRLCVPVFRHGDRCVCTQVCRWQRPACQLQGAPTLLKAETGLDEIWWAFRTACCCWKNPFLNTTYLTSSSSHLQVS